MIETVTLFFASLGALFLFGTVYFWLLGALFFSLMIFLTEDDHHIWASISLFAFIWIMSTVNDFSIVANPLTWLKWAAVYLVAGSVWSFIKWFSFLHKAKDCLKTLKDRFLVEHEEVQLVDGRFSTEPYPDSSKLHEAGMRNRHDSHPFEPQHDFDLFAHYLVTNNYVGRFLNVKSYNVNIEGPDDVIPTVGDRFSDLTGWIIWWPFSLFWTVLNDPIRRIAETIVRSMKGVYTAMAVRVVGRVKV